MKGNFTVLFLGAVILISSFIISDALKEIPTERPTDISSINYGLNELANAVSKLNEEQKQGPGEMRYYRKESFFYRPDLAKYLGITNPQLTELLSKESFDIPYIKVNGLYIFYKVAVDEWLKGQQSEFKVKSN